MSDSVESIVLDFCSQFNPGGQYQPFLDRANASGFAYLSRFFRACMASDSRRAALMKQGIRGIHAEEPVFFVCPHCGLIYAFETPEVCPVDQTPGTEFEEIR